MKTKTLLGARFALLVALGAVALRPVAQAAEVRHDKHSLFLQPVFDGEPDEFVWIMDGHSAFKSLRGKFLRSWVALLPEGSQIRYNPTDVRMGGEAAYEAEVSDFALFCEQHRLDFAITPAG